MLLAERFISPKKVNQQIEEEPVAYNRNQDGSHMNAIIEGLK